MGMTYDFISHQKLILFRFYPFIPYAKCVVIDDFVVFVDEDVFGILVFYFVCMSS